MEVIEMPRRTTTRPRKPAVTVHSLSLAAETIAQLERIASDLSDLTGRRVSLSGVVRILARHAEREGYVWTETKLLPLTDVQQHKVVWGKLPSKKPK